MAKRIVVEADHCLACKSCVIACAVAHAEGESLVSVAQCEASAEPRVHVEAVGDRGVPVQCQHCEEAPCTLVCPKEAIRRAGPDEPVLIDRELCISCKFCLFVCPFGAIDLAADGKAVLKCDLCAERVAGGELPACVEACPTGALRFEELDDALRDRRREHFARTAGNEATQPDASANEGRKKIMCRSCGAEIAPPKLLERLRQKLPEGVDVSDVCHRCRRREAAALLAEAPAAAVPTDR